MNQRLILISVVILATVGILVGAYTKFKDEIVATLSQIPKDIPQTPSNTDFFFSQPEKDADALQKVGEEANSLKQLNESSKVSDLKLESKAKTFSKFPGAYQPEQLRDKAAMIKTNKGIFYFLLFPETPLASSNFIFLTNQSFYDGLKFHRVEKNFVVQGGDPKGDGTGGPGYSFADEKVVGNYIKGTVAMANRGSDTNGSQFFIVLQDQPNLPPRYTIFGKVVKGLEVVEKLAIGDVMEKVSIVNVVQE